MSGSTNGSLKVWDFNTCSLVHTLLSGGNDQSAVTSVSIGPNGNIIASNGKRSNSTHTENPHSMRLEKHWHCCEYIENYNNTQMVAVALGPWASHSEDRAEP